MLKSADSIYFKKQQPNTGEENMKTKLILGAAALLLSVSAQAKVLVTCSGTGKGLVNEIQVEATEKGYTVTEITNSDAKKVYKVKKKEFSPTVSHKLVLLKNDDNSSKSLHLELYEADVKGAMLYDSGRGEFTNIEFLNCKK